MCQVQAQGCGLGWGLPVEKWLQLKVPGQQSKPLILPEPQPQPPPQPPSCTIYRQPTAPGSLRVTQTTPHPHPTRTSVDWPGARPDPAAHHTTPPPCPGSRKKKALEDLRLSSLRAWPHREREGEGLPRPGLRTWGEGWLKPNNPASRTSHPPS